MPEKSEGYALRTTLSVSLSAESESVGTFSEKSPPTPPKTMLILFRVSWIQIPDVLFIYKYTCKSTLFSEGDNTCQQNSIRTTASEFCG